MNKQQMSTHVGHVLKREPCHRCQLPVFLAERLQHAGHLYHRTCLRCARCQAQLAPGSFYETEAADGEFCCETCPDEEKPGKPQLAASSTAALSASSDQIDAEAAQRREATRQSFRHKLALFQARSAEAAALDSAETSAATSEAKGLLAKSLSDEEKSKSLKRLTALYAMQSAVGGGADAGKAADFVRRQLAEVGGKGGDVENENKEDSDTSGDDDEEEEEEDEDDNADDQDVVGSQDQRAAATAAAAAEDDPPPALPTVDPPSLQIIPAESLPTNEQNTAIQVEEEPAPAQAKVESLPAANQPEISIENDTTEPAAHSTATITEELILPVVPTPRKRISKVADAAEAEAATAPPKPAVRERTTLPDIAAVEVAAEPQIAAKPVAEKPPLPAKPVVASSVAAGTVDAAAYPDEFNPFGDDDEEEEEEEKQAAKPEVSAAVKKERRKSCNPFDSSDDEVELDKVDTLRANLSSTVAAKAAAAGSNSQLNKSLNPFGSDDEDEDEDALRSSPRRTPVPTPRKLIHPPAAGGTSSATSSIQSTPEPSRRPSRCSTTGLPPHHHNSSLLLNSSFSPQHLHRNSALYGSASSLASTASALNAYTRRYKKRAPLPPPAAGGGGNSGQPSPSGSGRSTPTQLVAAAAASVSSRKKRPAPKPPAAAATTPVAIGSLQFVDEDPKASSGAEEAVEAAAAVEENVESSAASQLSPIPASPPSAATEATAAAAAEEDEPSTQRKLIPLDASLLDDDEDHMSYRMSDNNIAAIAPNSAATAATEIVYRRTIVPSSSMDEDEQPAVVVEAVPNADHHDRQWQKMKENKESLNKNRQSQCSAASSPESNATNGSNGNHHNEPENNGCSPSTPTPNKSTFGKWKRRKAAAPAPPPPSATIVITQQKRRSAGGGVQMLPLTDIRYELEVIEVQQQGLEKQGIQLEKMIRERCEGSGAGSDGEQQQQQQQQPKPTLEELANTPNSKEVEDLILQLFEIVNEKNELFRRQAELMYLRRLHRLEQEQAEIEYDIRMLMEQPESNKTDSDKAREDGLIARKIEIVLQRNEVIDCLDSDRLREAEEDQSIKTRLDEHNARWDEELAAQLSCAPAKLSKKEKKKLRETKKLAKQKKMDADKDADESEVKAPGSAEAKKKKRKFLSILH